MADTSMLYEGLRAVVDEAIATDETLSTAEVLGTIEMVKLDLLFSDDNPDAEDDAE